MQNNRQHPLLGHPEHLDVIDERKSIKSTWAIPLLILLNVCMGVFTGYLIYVLVTETNTEQESRPTDLCVRCEDVRLHPDDGWEHVIAYDDVTCCVKPEHTGTLVAYFTEHWIRLKQVKENRQFTYCKSSESRAPKPSIKVMGLNHYQEDNGHARLAWNASHELAITDHEDISYVEEDKEIRIRKSGLYHVYSQILFEYNPQTMNLSGQPLLFRYGVHLVKAKDTIGRGQRVLLSMDTPCATESGVESSSSYLGSVLLLQTGDSLYVKVSSKKHVKPVPHMNIFGARML